MPHARVVNRSPHVFVSAFQAFKDGWASIPQGAALGCHVWPFQGLSKECRASCQLAIFRGAGGQPAVSESFDMTQRPLARNGFVISPARRRHTAARFTAALSALSLLLALFGFAAPSAAYAIPISTSFQDAIAASETIAIVRLVELPPEVDRNVPLRPKATLDVLQVLKGKLKLGDQQVGFTDYPSGNAGMLFVQEALRRT
jgi:hypothetical protein